MYDTNTKNELVKRNILLLYLIKFQFVIHDLILEISLVLVLRYRFDSLKSDYTTLNIGHSLYVSICESDRIYNKTVFT